MRRDTWFKCDPTDLIEGVETCENELQGLVYVMVLMRIYQSGGPIPNNPAAIGALCGRKGLSRTKTARVIGELVDAGKLTETDDGRLFNRRAGDELGERARLSDTRSEAGKQGGRPRKNDTTSGQKRVGNDSTSDSKRTENASKVGEKLEGTGTVSGDGAAENSQSVKPNASPRARAREEKIREESPQPPKGADEDDGQQPDERLTAEDRARLARNVAGVAERPPIPEDRIAKLTGEIMRLAKMTAPPIDLVLVERWITLGLDDDEILQIVSRMSAGARGSIRAFRYFDAEIKRQHEARGSADEAQLAEFKRISQRAQSP